MNYITYDEYKKIGGILDDAAYARFSMRTFSIITKETHNRIEKMKEIPEEVKHACRDIIEYMHNNLSADKALSSTSQSQGGVSESEVYVYIKQTEHKDAIVDIVYDYLSHISDDLGTPLLYRGAIG